MEEKIGRLVLRLWNEKKALVWGVDVVMVDRLGCTLKLSDVMAGNGASNAPRPGKRGTRQGSYLTAGWGHQKYQGTSIK